MYRIRTHNKISPKGLSLLDSNLFEVGENIEEPDAILVRSYKLHDTEFPESVKAIARAGAGVNNVPVERCTNAGIVVFNTPGANANSVKELVISGLLLSSRKIHEGLEWVQTLRDKGDEVSALVEKEKSSFAGPEIAGKTLGVVGLGAIGVMVSNAALALGMEVVGFDPYLSVESAWGLSGSVSRARNLDALLAQSDYISLHVPLNGSTKSMIDATTLSKVKPGARLLNFARGGLVNNQDLLSALDAGILSVYVTDFPEAELLGNAKVLAVPHLGASTPEAEENCAIMAARQLSEFLLRGNIVNSVNFPECQLDYSNNERILIANRNIPNMVGQITTILADANINIQDLINRHYEDIAYNIIDLDARVPAPSIEKIRNIDGVIALREIHPEERTA
ncbi:MAG: phosphoglycerate dehydrogenase [Spirochaetaceae bacterium]